MPDELEDAFGIGVRTEREMPHLEIDVDDFAIFQGNLKK
jgi:hypothetical protein